MNDLRTPSDLVRDLPKIKMLTSLEIRRLQRLADRMYEEAIDLNPADANLLFLYARYLAEHRPEETIKIDHYFVRALRVNPFDAEIARYYREWKAKATNAPASLTKESTWKRHSVN